MLGLKKRELGIWLGYIAMLCATIPWHEPWNDEAQAWLLARDLGARELVFHALRYESHPPLWYLILWLPAHLHVSYLALSWISGAIAAAGIYLLLRFAPFPFYLRAVLPFTYFLAYQYAVVARSYALFPLLGFAVAHVYRTRPKQPVLLAVLLSLLANVSVHGSLVACAFAAVYGWKLWRERRGPESVSADRKSLLLAAGIFVASLLLVAAAVRPAKDMTTVATPTVMHALKINAPPTTLSASIPSVSSATTSSVPANAPAAQGGLRYKLKQLPRIASYAITSFKLLAFLLYLLVAFYLYRRQKFLLLLPLLTLLLFLAFVYAREWHMGLLWITLLMVLWVSWDSMPEAGLLTPQNALAGFLFLLCVLQLSWTFHAVRYDIRQPYSGSKMTAAYLKTLSPGTKIAGFNPQSTAILPYFSRNIFFNQTSYSYWLWSTRNMIDADAATAIAAHPGVIVLFRKASADKNNPPMWQYALQQGYVETHRFCGQSNMPNADNEYGCYLVLQPAPGQP